MTLKFLPDAVARDAQALARFRREAQAASALNHPAICTIHEISEESGQAFIAMEFLEGQTLKHRIAGSPHGLGNVAIARDRDLGCSECRPPQGNHRDIKPVNVFITVAATPRFWTSGSPRLPIES